MNVEWELEIQDYYGDMKTFVSKCWTYARIDKKNSQWKWESQIYSNIL